MSDSGVQICPVCKVKIIKMIGGDRVVFSAGAPGTRATLWARVCQYAQSPACINKDKENLGIIQPQDYYQSPRKE
jgi:hypothetical protein